MQGALVMPRGGFGRGRPSLGSKAMIGKNVHLSPEQWEFLSDCAKEEEERLKSKGKERKVTHAEILRRAVEFFEEKGNQPEASSAIPMLGVIFGGKAMECSGQQTIQEAGEESMLSVPFIVEPDSYALLVVGDSMESNIGFSVPSGDYAIFESREYAPPFAFVHVEWEDEKGVRVCTFKQFIPQADGSAVFRALNPKCPDQKRLKGQFEIRGVFANQWDGGRKPRLVQ
jgi:SOS-response transcriptional repressor LexA